MSDANRTRMLGADQNRTLLGADPRMDANRTVMGTAPSINATQTIKPVQCPVCKTFNPSGVIFCVDCGLIFDRALPDDAFGAPAVQLPMMVEASGKEQPIRPGTSTVGREGDLVITDGRISRVHAKFRSEAGKILLEDLGSTNGTKVNGQPLTKGQPAELIGGETISFGGVEVRLSLPGAPKGDATQVFASNKTAAISAPPQKTVAPATLVGNGTRYPLKAGLNTFGRRAENDVVISDPYVSGRHGVIEIEEGGTYITDTGSSNGTVLNEARLSPNMRTTLEPTDVIRLGSMEFTVVRNANP